MMRRTILTAIVYAVHAFAPPFPPHGDASVTDAAAKVVAFSRTKSPEVSPEQAVTCCIFGNISSAKFIKPTGSHSVNRRKRKRVRRVVHRKPPTVIVLPDVVKPMSAAEVERERKAKEMVRWVTWF